MKAVMKLSKMRRHIAMLVERPTLQSGNYLKARACGGGEKLGLDCVIIGLDRVPVFPLYQRLVIPNPRCSWGGVAQLVRAADHNPRVGGSSPSSATILQNPQIVPTLEYHLETSPQCTNC